MDKTFGLGVYHEFVSWAMLTGFKWVRYSRDGDFLRVWNLKSPNYIKGVTDKECAERFERWYNWMKGQ